MASMNGLAPQTVTLGQKMTRQRLTCLSTGTTIWSEGLFHIIISSILHAKVGGNGPPSCQCCAALTISLIAIVTTMNISRFMFVEEILPRIVVVNQTMCMCKNIEQNTFHIVLCECQIANICLTSRYYEEFQIDRRTGESNLTQLYIQVCRR